MKTGIWCKKLKLSHLRYCNNSRGTISRMGLSLSTLFHHITFFTIKVVHLCCVAYAVGGPFSTNKNSYLFLHAFLTTFVMLHWKMNNNECGLTQLERHISINWLNKNPNQKFFLAQLIEPVYDFKQNYSRFSTLIYLVTGLLTATSVAKICRNLYTLKMLEHARLV